jgi:glycosyltransferase involved in cell wall biosynthesis
MYRIFHLIKGLGRGGAEKLLSEGIRYQDTARFEYGYGYFLDWKNALVQDLRNSGGDVHCFHSRTPAGIVFSAKRVANFLQRWQADLIHCHLPLAGIAGRLAGRIAKIPVLYTEHNVQDRYHPITRIINQWSWRFQEGVVAVSKEVADSIRSFADSSVAVRIVQNGVAPEIFVPSAEDRLRVRNQLGIPSEAPVIGTVAGFRRQKQLHDWLQAASLLQTEIPDCHFVIVGDGPLRNELEALVKTLRLSSRVHFAGTQETVIPFYSAMDVYMISSLYEGLPVALLEAMAMRLPVVTTPAGGIPEVITDGHTGFIVNFHDLRMLAEKAKVLIENQSLRRTIGDRGRRVIEERFSIRNMIRELEAIYMQICENQRRNLTKIQPKMIV